MPDSTSQTADAPFTPTPAGPIATPGGTWNPDPDAGVFAQHQSLRNQEVAQAQTAIQRETFKYWHDAALSWQQANHMASAIGNLAKTRPDLALDPLAVTIQRPTGGPGRSAYAHAYARADYYAKLMKQDLDLASGGYVGPLPQGPPPPTPADAPPAGTLAGQDQVGTVWWVALGLAAVYALGRIVFKRSAP